MNKIYKILLEFLTIGILLTFLAFFGWLSKFLLVILFCLIIILILQLLVIFLKKIPKLPKFEFILFCFFTLIWSLHFLQVLVPETGFDALWYHLPVVDAVFKNKGLIYLPDLYQSLNPLFADLYFLTGYATAGILGTKIVAYIFAFLLTIVSFFLARIFMNRKFSLFVAILVSTFQVVTWQSSSFYVDTAKAFFEVTGLLFLLPPVFDKSKKIKDYLFAALFFSASLGTKLFSILLLPVFVYFAEIAIKLKKQKQIMFYIFLFFIPVLYYYFAYTHTGTPFYSLEIHLKKLQEIGGESNLIKYLFIKLISLPYSIIVFLFSRDYVNPFLSLLFIPIGLKIKNILKDEKLKILFIFSIYQWIIWWLLPPTSTRYALSGFITFLILGLTLVVNFYIKNKQQKKKFVWLLLIICFSSILPRIIIAQRSLQYILTPQTQKEYLIQFYDGSIDDKISDWYYR